jgi:predicted RNA-binding protein YlxR (DUF448 family)
MSESMRRPSSISREKEEERKRSEPHQPKEIILKSRKQRIKEGYGRFKSGSKKMASSSSIFLQKQIKASRFKYICPEKTCTYATNNKQHLKRHMKHEHGKTISDAKASQISNYAKRFLK